MKIEAGKSYLNGDGTRVDIMGLARPGGIEQPGRFWSLQGDHYYENGHFIDTVSAYGRDDMWEEITRSRSQRNIVSETTDRETWLAQELSDLA